MWLDYFLLFAEFPAPLINLSWLFSAHLSVKTACKKYTLSFFSSKTKWKLWLAVTYKRAPRMFWSAKCFSWPLNYYPRISHIHFDLVSKCHRFDPCLNQLDISYLHLRRFFIIYLHLRRFFITYHIKIAYRNLNLHLINNPSKDFDLKSFSFLSNPGCLFLTQMHSIGHNWQ